MKPLNGANKKRVISPLISTVHNVGLARIMIELMTLEESIYVERYLVRVEVQGLQKRYAPALPPLVS